MNRRNFLTLAASTLPAALGAKPFAQPIGLNLFTVRAPLVTAPAKTYQALGEIGVKTLEVRPLNLNQHASMMRDAGLTPVHMFIESAIITGAWEEWQGFMQAAAARLKLPAPPPPAANAPRPRLEEMIDLARRHGVKRIGTSMLLPVERATAIDAINKAAGQCAAAGIELYYHNHAFEFEGKRGARFLDRLHISLDPRVRLELDVFWAALGGDDPAAVIRQWKGRVRSLHLKDAAPGARFPGSELDVPPASFRELGKGRLDFRSILRSAQNAGVEHYFVELDHSPGDPIDSVRNCVQYLKGLAV